METEYRSKLNYQGNELYFENQKLSQVVQDFSTPLYLYSQNDLTGNLKEFQKAASVLDLDFEVCFALKANSNKELLKILASQGAGADIVSVGELQRALSCGIPASKIVFSGVGKREDEIEKALKADIYSFNVESFEELEMINQLAKRLNKTASVAFRLNPKVKAITHKYISTGFKTHKFGILEEDIFDSLGHDKYWSHSKLAGLSVHIGSQLIDLKATGEAIKAVSNAAKKLPFALDFIDVGGGIGVNYAKDQTPKAPSLDAYMRTVKENLNPGGRVKVIFEPGRRIIASSGVFLSKVIRSKTSADCHFLIIDGGMNDFARPSLYEAYHEILPSKLADEKAHVDIVGPICETADCFGEKRLLPKLKAGDFVAIADTGAYGYSMSSNYNLRPRPQEVLLTEQGSLKQINSLQNIKEI